MDKQCLSIINTKYFPSIYGQSIEEVPIPENDWSSELQLNKFLNAIVYPGEFIWYKNSFSKGDDGYLYPDKGTYIRSQSLLEQLKEYSLESAIKPNPVAGAYVGVNPVDGSVSQRNTDYRHVALVCHNASHQRVYTLMKALKLPISALVLTKYSLQAVVKIEATTREDFDIRRSYLYSVCKKNGLIANEEYSHHISCILMPGTKAGNDKHVLIETDSGCQSYQEWQNWIASQEDNLPQIENISRQWNSPPKLSQELIEGVLRKGHKLLISGPAKAGKSFDLIELSLAIASGTKWHGWKCCQGKVLYVNLELDEASCYNRFQEVFKYKQININTLENISVWNLRGKSMSLDLLAPKLIARAKQCKFDAIIIDPIYKIITGDENNAEQMGKFCNNFDSISHELKCSIICCHHHSKGNQGQKKASDRSSGSGVFSRDPDALLDLIELEINDKVREVLTASNICIEIQHLLSKYIPEWQVNVPPEYLGNQELLLKEADKFLDQELIEEARLKATFKAQAVSAWKIEGTLREFASFKPRNCFFAYPIHIPDNTLLNNARFKYDNYVRRSSTTTKVKSKQVETELEKKVKQEEREKEIRKQIEEAFTVIVLTNEKVTISELAGYLGKSEKQVRRYISLHPDFNVLKGVVHKTQGGEEENA